MAFNQALKRLVKCRDVKRPIKQTCTGNIVVDQILLQLINDPQPPLGMGRVIIFL